MKTFKAIASTVVAMAVLSIALVAPASADSLPSASKKTTVTMTHPLEIPGQVLPAGKYFFRVMDVVGTRNLVQITNENEKPIAILIAVPNYRLKATQSPVLEFHERPAGAPHAVRAWFFAREKSGLEFVYPKQEAIQLAKESNEVVPAEAVEPAENNVQALKTVVIVAITPTGQEEPVQTAIQTITEPIQVAQTLPSTASQTPLIALLGGLFLTMGLGLKQLSRQRS